MKTAVVDIGVFFATVGTHFERSHSRLCPVIRNILYDRETRAAVSAVYKRVIYTVFLCFHVFQAISTNGKVRADPGNLVGHRFTFNDAEVRENFICYQGIINGFDMRSLWCLVFQRLQKIVKGFRSTVDPDTNAVVSVFDMAFKPELLGKPVNKRPEPDPLHQPFNFYLKGFQFFSCKTQPSTTEPLCKATKFS